MNNIKIRWMANFCYGATFSASVMVSGCYTAFAPDPGEPCTIDRSSKTVPVCSEETIKKGADWERKRREGIEK